MTRFVSYPDPRLIRLRNPETRAYLHLSADRETTDQSYAWLGYRTQAAVLRDRAKAEGKPWPYRPEARTPQRGAVN